MSYLSDYFPPTFVRDWRKFLHAKAFMIVAIVFYCIVWLTLLGEDWKEIGRLMEGAGTASGFESFNASGGMDSIVQGRMTMLSIKMFIAASVPMLFILPLRMASAVAADTRGMGTNFLQVTPLSTWKIVWGMWLASFSQILVLGALYIPVLAARAYLMPMGYGNDCYFLLALVLFGGVYSAFFLFSGGLIGILRFALLAVSIVFAVYLPFGLDSYIAKVDMANVAPVVACDLVCMGLAVFMLLQLARRPYAAPAENTSLVLRFLSMGCLLVSSGLIVGNIFHPAFFPEYKEMEFVAMFLLLLALTGTVLDAILPTYSMPVHALRTVPGLPAWPQMPGLLQSVLAVLPCLYVLALSTCMDVLPATGENAGLTAAFQQAVPLALAYWTPLLLSVWVVDFMCRRIRPVRPLLVLVMGFAFFMALFMLMGIVTLAMDSNDVPECFKFFPFLNAIAMNASLQADGVIEDYTTHLISAAAESAAILGLLILRSRSGNVVR